VADFDFVLKWLRPKLELDHELGGESKKKKKSKIKSILAFLKGHSH